MPYGIQQPAVSGQLLQLEKSLGVKLFNRRPFTLTPAGERLYDYVYPFFSRLGDVEQQLRGEEGRHLRLAASASVLRTHLPDLLQAMKKKEPKLKLSLREVEPSDVMQMLSLQHADVAISIMHGRLTEGMHFKELTRVPLALLVPTSMKVKKFEDFLEDANDGTGLHGKYPLVSLLSNEILAKQFQKRLDEKSVRWNSSVEVSSLDVVQEYVLRGFGVGLGVDVPGSKPIKGIKKVALKGFDPLVIGALYQGRPKPVAKWFLEEAEVYVKKAF